MGGCELLGLAHLKNHDQISVFCFLGLVLFPSIDPIEPLQGAPEQVLSGCRCFASIAIWTLVNLRYDIGSRDIERAY